MSALSGLRAWPVYLNGGTACAGSSMVL